MKSSPPRTEKMMFSKYRLCEKGRQAERQAGREAGRQRSRQRGIRQRGRQRGRQADRQVGMKAPAADVLKNIFEK
jgi:hypothetical protein